MWINVNHRSPISMSMFRTHKTLRKPSNGLRTGFLIHGYHEENTCVDCPRQSPLNASQDSLWWSLDFQCNREVTYKMAPGEATSCNHFGAVHSGTCMDPKMLNLPSQLTTWSQYSGEFWHWDGYGEEKNGPRFLETAMNFFAMQAPVPVCICDTKRHDIAELA